MFEHHREPLLSRRAFLWRQLRFTLAAAGMILGSLLMGMAGYHFLGDRSRVDSLVTVSMLLGRMGPVSEPDTNTGKLFAGFYALYAGLVFLLVSAVLLAPILHRFLHSLHLETETDSAQPDA